LPKSLQNSPSPGSARIPIGQRRLPSLTDHAGPVRSPSSILRQTAILSHSIPTQPTLSRPSSASKREEKFYECLMIQKCRPCVNRRASTTSCGLEEQLVNKIPPAISLPFCACPSWLFTASSGSASSLTAFSARKDVRALVSINDRHCLLLVQKSKIDCCSNAIFRKFFT
jgi:hypothetical protein